MDFLGEKTQDNQDKPSDEIQQLQAQKASLENAFEQLNADRESLKQELDFAMKMINSSPTYFFTASPECITLLMNETMARALGYKSTEVIGKDFIKYFVFPGEQLHVLKHWKELQNHKSTVVFETILLNKDRSQRAAEIHCSAILNNQKEIDVIFGVGIDTSIRNRAQKIAAGTAGEFEPPAEDSPRRIEEKYRQLIENLAEGMFVVQGIPPCIVYANPVAAEIFGYTIEELIEMNEDQVLGLLAAGDEPAILRRFEEVLKGATPQRNELCIKAKDGAVKWIQIFGQTMTYNGKPSIVITFFDITVQRQTLDHLRESEGKYRALIDKSPLGLVIAQGIPPRMVYVNEVIAEITGYTIHELMNFSLEQTKELIYQDDRALFFGRYQSRLAGEVVPSSYEFRINRKDGQTRWIRIYSSRIMYNGEPAVQASFLDITGHRQMQNELQESERKYRTLIDNALIGVYKTNLSGQFIYANNAFARMLDYNDPDDLTRVPVEAMYCEASARSRFLTVLKENGRIDHHEIALRTKRGQEKTMLVSAILENDIISGMIVDISDRQHMQERLKDNLEKYQGLMLNTIHAMASMLETRDPYTAGHQHRVAELVLCICVAMDLSETQVKGLHTAAMIHDIGKIYVPAEILSRPSTLTESEFALIKIHPMVGRDILTKIDFPWPVADIVLQHHERLNGTGYPKGLKGDEIMIEARILAVADVIEAMSSHRPYRAALSTQETLSEIEQNAGILYDPVVVEIALDLIKEKRLLIT